MSPLLTSWSNCPLLANSNILLIQSGVLPLALILAAEVGEVGTGVSGSALDLSWCLRDAARASEPAS